MKFQLVRKIFRDILIITSGYPKRLLGSKVGKRVICFHEIKDPQKLRRMLTWLKENYDVVSLEALLKQPFIQKSMVAITFDDGYDSWHELAAPVLEELNIPATFFVCSGFVGLDKEKARQFLRTYTHRRQELYPLTREQLSDLARHPLFEIGSHTVHHINLGKCWEQETLQAEILGDRKQLQDWTGENVRWFAYPFGMKQHISEDAVKFLEHAQFSGAFTLIPEFLTRDSNRYRIGRDGLDSEDSPLLWHAWLQGDYDFWYRLKEKMVRGN